LPSNILVKAAVRSVKTYIQRKVSLTPVTNLKFPIGVLAYKPEHEITEANGPNRNIKIATILVCFIHDYDS